MTESHSPVETALDLFLYAPVGLALTAAEEIPKLAAKGRTRLTQQLTMAKMVGQFAVTQGRKEINRRFAPPARPAPAPAAAPPAAAAPSERDVSYERLLGDGERGAAADSASPGAAGARPARASATGTNGAAAGASGGAGAEGPGVDGPGVHSLAIPGYDSLAASQVVQRLAGLSQDELEAVGAYEASHRNRRTILSRVRQLQAG